MRLTKKSGLIYRYNFDTHCDVATRELRSIETHNKIVNKLGQYEDIEELCEKMLKQPVYIKPFCAKALNDIIFKEYEIIEKRYDGYYSVYYNIATGEIIVFDHNILDIDFYNIDEYGKVWTFNKVELENDTI